MPIDLLADDGPAPTTAPAPRDLLAEFDAPAPRDLLADIAPPSPVEMATQQAHAEIARTPGLDPKAQQALVARNMAQVMPPAPYPGEYGDAEAADWAAFQSQPLRAPGGIAPPGRSWAADNAGAGNIPLMLATGGMSSNLNLIPQGSRADSLINAGAGGAAGTAAGMLRTAEGAILAPAAVLAGVENPGDPLGISKAAGAYGQTYQHQNEWPEKIASGFGSAVMTTPAWALGPWGALGVGATAGYGAGQMEIDQRKAAGEYVSPEAEWQLPIAYALAEGIPEALGAKFTMGMLPQALKAVGGIVRKSAVAGAASVVENAAEEEATQILQNDEVQHLVDTGRMTGHRPGTFEGSEDALWGSLGGAAVSAPVAVATEAQQARQQQQQPPPPMLPTQPPPPPSAGPQPGTTPQAPPPTPPAPVAPPQATPPVGPPAQQATPEQPLSDEFTIDELLAQASFEGVNVNPPPPLQPFLPPEETNQYSREDPLNQQSIDELLAQASFQDQSAPRDLLAEEEAAPPPRDLLAEEQQPAPAAPGGSPPAVGAVVHFTDAKGKPGVGRVEDIDLDRGEYKITTRGGKAAFAATDAVRPVDPAAYKVGDKVELDGYRGTSTIIEYDPATGKGAVADESSRRLRFTLDQVMPGKASVQPPQPVEQAVDAVAQPETFTKSGQHVIPGTEGEVETAESVERWANALRRDVPGLTPDAAYNGVRDAIKAGREAVAAGKERDYVTEDILAKLYFGENPTRADEDAAIAITDRIADELAGVQTAAADTTPSVETPPEEYSGGDRIQLTGKTERISGGEFEEFVYLEGTKKGKKGVRPTKAQQDVNTQQKQQAHKDEQEGFRRVAESQKPAPAFVPETPARTFKRGDKVKYLGNTDAEVLIPDLAPIQPGWMRVRTSDGKMIDRPREDFYEQPAPQTPAPVTEPADVPTEPVERGEGREGQADELAGLSDAELDQRIADAEREVEAAAHTSRAYVLKAQAVNLRKEKGYRENKDKYLAGEDVDVRDFLHRDPRLSVEHARRYRVNDEARRATMVPVPSDIPGVKLWASPGQEKTTAAVGKKMADLKAAPRAKFEAKPRNIPKPFSMPKAIKPGDEGGLVGQMGLHVKDSPGTRSQGTAITAVKIDKKGKRVSATDGRRAVVIRRDKGEFGADGMHWPVGTKAKSTLKAYEGEGTFPPVDDILSGKNNAQPVEIDVQATITKLRMASNLTTDENRGVLVVLNKNGTLGFAGVARGDFETMGVIGVQPDAQEMGAVNPDYLREILETAWAVTENGKVKISWEKPSKPIFVLASGRGFHVEAALMPVNAVEATASSVRARITGKPEAVNLDEDTGGGPRRNPMRPRGATQLPGSQPTTDPFQDPAVEERYQAAKGIDRPSFISRLLEGAGALKREMTRHFVHLDTKKPDDANLANIMRLREAAVQNAPNKAQRDMTEWVRGLEKQDYDRFGRLLVLPDILKDIDAGLYDGKSLPFGFRDKTHVERELARLTAAAGPRVQAATDARNKAVRDLTERMVDLGLLNQDVLADDRYFHRQVMEYMQQRQSMGIGGKGPDARLYRRGFQKARVGGGDFNTDYAQAEHEYLTHAYRQIATAETLERIKSEFDISPKLRKQHGKAWAQNLPDGYVLWSPRPGDQFAVTRSFSEAVVDKLLAGQIDLADATVQELLVKVPGEQYAIPEHFARQLDTQPRTNDNVITQASAQLLSAWKQWTLLNPVRAFLYNLNNSSGDVDAGLAADPAIVNPVRLKRAGRDLWEFARGRGNRAEMERLMDMGVIGSGESLHEIPDINDAAIFRTLSGGKYNPVKWYWGKVRGGTALRENVTRLAAYRRARELLSQGRSVLWASKPSELDAITDFDERAAKLSRDLIGDYGNVSAGGQIIRERYIPFWSWMEINTPRYVRLFRNAAREGRTGRTGVAAAGVAGRNLALMTVKASLLYGLIAAFNAAVFPDEDDGFEDGRLRLLLGKNSAGRVFGVRFQGAFSDAISWLDLQNAPGHYLKWRRGEESGSDVAWDMVKATPRKLANSVLPFHKTAAEVASGKSFFPDPLDPRPIRDRTEHGLGIGGRMLQGPYRAAKDLPGGGLTENIAGAFVQSHDPGENAYNKSRGVVHDWLEDQGKERSAGEPTERSNALYYHRKFIVAGNKEKADKWLKRYRELGGEDEAKSIEMAHPLASIPATQREAFRASLSPQQRTTLKRAEDWYFRTYYGDGAAGARSNQERISANQVTDAASDAANESARKAIPGLAPLLAERRDLDRKGGKDDAQLTPDERQRKYRLDGAARVADRHLEAIKAARAAGNAEAAARAEASLRAAVADDTRLAFEAELTERRKAKKQWSELKKADKPIPPELRRYAKFAPDDARLQKLESSDELFASWEKQVREGKMTPEEAEKLAKAMLGTRMKKAG